jgi:hypothetical protein
MVNEVRTRSNRDVPLASIRAHEVRPDLKSAATASLEKSEARRPPLSRSSFGAAPRPCAPAEDQ